MDLKEFAIKWILIRDPFDRGDEKITHYNSWQVAISSATDSETATFTPTMTVSAVPTEEPPGPFSSAYYTYDGDDNMVMSVINGVTTYYASSSYVVEVDGSDTTVRKTYSAGSTSIAVRTIVNETSETLNWLLSDHLGSSSITTNADGSWNSEIRYSAFGETRYSSGITPTDYRYTNQLEQKDVNLYYYNARYYDAALGWFVQADTIVPGAGDSKSYDRYAYVNNNPMIYIDPSGHGQDGAIGDPTCNPRDPSCNSIWEASKSDWVFVASVAYNIVFLRDYGINLIKGNLTDEDASSIRIAVQTISRNLAYFDPQNRTPQQVFQDEFGSVQMQSKDPDGSGIQGCDHDGYGFYCLNMAGHWDKYLVAHELGHDFAQANGKVHYDMMFHANQFNSLGEMVFGNVDGTYKRTFLGMLSDQPPYAYHGHSLYPGDTAHLTQNEDFADTFANWTYGSFNYDVESIIDRVKNSNSGSVRKNWMDVNMVEWLNN